MSREFWDSEWVLGQFCDSFRQESEGRERASCRKLQ